MKIPAHFLTVDYGGNTSDSIDGWVYPPLHNLATLLPNVTASPIALQEMRP